MSTVSETLETVRAAERFLTRVDPHVYLQIPFPAALFPTDMAAMQFYPGVAGHVLSQNGRTVALFTAHVTTFRALV